MLLAFLILFYGANAVGILLMHEVQDQAQHDIMGAVMQSLSSGHRLIGVAILALLIVLAAYLVVALLLLVCKIPFLGPILFTFVLPVSAVLIGVLMFSLLYVMMPLAGPAVWSGSTTFQAIARLFTIAKSKLLSVIMHQFILFVIVMFVVGIIFGILIIGMLSVGGMAAGILGFGSMNFSDFFSEGLNGHLIAGAIGGGLLYAVALVIPALIAVKGACIIYLNAIQGLDFGHAEAQLESGMAAVKKKAEEARERARQMTEQRAKNAPADGAPSSSTPPTDSVSPAAPAAPVASAPPVAPAVAAQTAASVSAPTQAAAQAPARAPATACPSCHVPVASDDVFCGNCGHKLK